MKMLCFAEGARGYKQTKPEGLCNLKTDLNRDSKTDVPVTLWFLIFSYKFHVMAARS